MRKTGFRRRLIVGVLAMGLVGASAQLAAQTYPSRPIKFIVPLPAGAGTDVLARKFAQLLGEGLGQAIVVENKPGAGTALGADFVARSTPDGYTLLVATTSTLSVSPSLQKLPYDVTKDFIPVAAFASAPFVLVVPADSRFKTFAELLAGAKAQPGMVTFASSGTGTMTHMVVELASVVGKVNLLHVPYKGVVAAYSDLYGGRIDLIADAPASTIAPVQAGKLRALVVTGPRRLSSLPDVPTVADMGLSGAEAEFVTGVLAPAGTPPDVIARLESETLKVSRSTALKDFLLAQGYESLSASSQEFAASNRDELRKWSGVVRDRNIKAD